MWVLNYTALQSQMKVFVKELPFYYSSLNVEKTVGETVYTRHLRKAMIKDIGSFPAAALRYSRCSYPGERFQKYVDIPPDIRGILRNPVLDTSSSYDACG